jgi:hypothetical protein
MIFVIEFLLISSLVFFAYHDWHTQPGETTSHTPALRRRDTDLDRLDLDRLRRDMEVASGAGSPAEDAKPDIDAEAREAELTRELIAGNVDPATYQRLMGELAHGSTQSGGAR